MCGRLSHMEIGMAWLYMDESAEHGPGGKVRRFTLGGAIATAANWKNLCAEWTGHLNRFSHHGIEWFHMTDFEARKKPYDKIQDEERKALLNGLLEIALRHVPIFFGTVDEPSHEPLWLRYAGAVIKTQKNISIAAETYGPVTLVLAKINGVKSGLLRDKIVEWSDPKVFKFGGFGEPRQIAPLQVADIAAYEFSRAMRENKPEKERYPLSRLKTASGGCHLISTKFLKGMPL